MVQQRRCNVWLSQRPTQFDVEDGSMEKKTARLTILIDPDKKAAFEELCAGQDITPSQVLRQMIRDYLTEHGVDYKARIAQRAAKDE